MTLIWEAWSLLRRFWWAIPTLGLAIALFLTRGALERRTAQWEAEKSAHLQTVANYRAAAETARRKDLENVQRVNAEQQAITERITHEYESKLASAGAGYQRLLATAKAHSSRPGAADLSGTSEAACRAFSGTDCNSIPPLLKAAQDNTDKLIALQAWNRDQAAVDIGNDR